MRRFGCSDRIPGTHFWCHAFFHTSGATLLVLVPHFWCHAFFRLVGCCSARLGSVPCVFPGWLSFAGEGKADLAGSAARVQDRSTGPDSQGLEPFDESLGSFRRVRPRVPGVPSPAMQVPERSAHDVSCSVHGLTAHSLRRPNDLRVSSVKARLLDALPHRCSTRYRYSTVSSVQRKNSPSSSKRGVPNSQPTRWVTGMVIPPKVRSLSAVPPNG